MGQESNRTLGRRRELKDQLPPSTVAGLLRMAGRSLGGPDSGQAEPPGEATGARPGDTGRQEPGETGEQQAGHAGTRPEAVPRPRKRQAEPSWARVIGTTARLWVRRHMRTSAGRGPGSAEWARTGEPAAAGRRRLVLTLVAGAIVVVVAGAVFVGLSGQTGTIATHGKAAESKGRGASGLSAIANVRTQTAAWVARQVSQDAIVACDPVMCRSLQAQGLAAQNLLTLQASASDPLGSDVVVATAAVRSQFGSRLAGVYAPAVMASFGTGNARIDVRAVAPDGTAAYLAALRSDQVARQNAGMELAHNAGITMAPAAARELTAGQVDSRLLITLAAIAARNPVRLAGFGGAAQGASPGIPLRSADISAAGSSGAAGLASDLTFVRAQLPPYRPLLAQVVRTTGGNSALHIDFGAPSPLGLLGARGIP